MAGQPRITFFFPYRPPSGVSTTFVRLAEFLTVHHGIQTQVVDYRDGSMARMLRDGSHVRLLPFADGVRLEVPSDAILVMPAVLPYKMRPELRIDPRARLLYWNLSYFGLVNTLLPLPSLRNLQFKYPHLYKTAMRTFLPGLQRTLRGFIDGLVAHRALIFPERYSAAATAELLGLSIPNPIFVPVPIEVGPARGPRAGFDPEHLQFAWVGRLYDFKIHILLYTLRRLAAYAHRTRSRLTFHVVGDGPEGRRLRALEGEDKFFRIVRMGDLGAQSLEEYLVERIDVVTAMGASALEAARWGIPTVLLDFSYFPIRGDYKFRWLFEARGYDTGHALTADDLDPGNRSLESMMRALESDYAMLCARSHEYVRGVHDLSHISRRFHGAAQGTSLRYGDVNARIVRKGTIRRIYEMLRYRW